MDITTLSAAIALLPALGAGVAMGMATGKAVDAVARQPEANGKISSLMLLGMALTESCAIYGFVVSLIILFVK